MGQGGKATHKQRGRAENPFASNGAKTQNLIDLVKFFPKRACVLQQVYNVCA